MTNENEKPKGVTPVAKVVEVPTQYGRAIELPDGSIVNVDELLVSLWNKVDSIQRSIG